MTASLRKQDIDALIVQIKSQYKEIEKLYNASLRDKEIKSDLKIKIKSYLENARSVLDYCAHDIADVIGITAHRIYFPIVGKHEVLVNFEGCINRNLLGLESTNKKVFDYLEGIQPYHSDYAWLADFATVTIDNKHSQLTPQTRTETERITSTHSGGGQVSWNPSAVRFGSGAWINSALVNPVTQIPIPTPETTVIRKIWVDFLFYGTISVLPLLKRIHDKIPKIIDDVYKLL